MLCFSLGTSTKKSCGIYGFMETIFSLNLGAVTRICKLFISISASLPVFWQNTKANYKTEVTILKYKLQAARSRCGGATSELCY